MTNLLQPHTVSDAERLLELARGVLEIEAQAVRSLQARLGEAFLRAHELMLATRGRVVVTGMLTPRGIFELKYFFGSHVSTDTGGACSATAIRALIKQLAAAEDGRKPLSDHRISDILAQQGIQVARRTVAKYREAMHIQPANLRKSI